MIVQIPFAGFYCSLHDSEIDHQLEQMMADSSGNPNSDLVNFAYGGSFGHVHDAYAAAYAARFLRKFGIAGEFESMKSPREYNFLTDRIFCTIDETEMRRVLAETPRSLLERSAREWFTSRSGFISSYSPDCEDWGEFAEWDHNQTGCLIAAHVLHKCEGEQFDSGAEFDLMEPWLSNGNCDNALSECPVINRAANIASYLRTREERACRHG